MKGQMDSDLNKTIDDWWLAHTLHRCLGFFLVPILAYLFQEIYNVDRKRASRRIMISKVLFLVITSKTCLHSKLQSLVGSLTKPKNEAKLSLIMDCGLLRSIFYNPYTTELKIAVVDILFHVEETL
jgi:hypothetical protein